ncbi:hypothetical protein O1M63_32785 [Streptomyces mirabilis]|nr:hypothetical protein [Streptomyces mirabilis]
MVGADLVARTLVPPLEIPVGALTSWWAAPICSGCWAGRAAADGIAVRTVATWN